MMKRTQTWAMLALTAMMGLQAAWADVPKQQVSTSFSILENITLALLGKNNAVKVHTLVGINGNSHTYQLRALDVQTMQQSQLIVFNGLGFESAAMQRAAASTKVPVIEAGLGLHDLLHGGHEHHDEEDAHEHAGETAAEHAEHVHEEAAHPHEAAGHDHAAADAHSAEAIDPHVWLDPLNMPLYTANISKALIKQQPQQAQRLALQ